ncbi:GTP binding protein Nog1 [Schizosaccharomyces japonicus yFS275]|uniref:Nucleolar GTP-binding protein 1 n=1 Tax=Schizosaccharomyces japonicus (strain yFS275 / FY16936) TaxID=402676 RepID=B6K864_SCHJY|nr:GTP binding protein Nog1 [Schizosaccharomyces japonicus yFS275]EEB09718.1 GTP binding protein Nog1 [Schizosaccharomyces japonicus yFS275]
MATAVFKNISPIPDVNTFLDVVLSRTQRKTPTVIRAGFKISRIRGFYARKVKFTEDTFSEKLNAILTEFPKLNDIHPFHADLLNILYDRDHLKIALSQLSTARHLIENVARDYIRLLKYGDSLYRCKQLKRAALGRMATIIKRQKSSLEFLEQVRQHMSRLPAVDPNTRTLLVCGYPNVGKSSFMNKITRAQVDVQPYAFTTKSLYVGHFDYKYLRWQVIDTPGILDHPLEQMNTIEMQSITAMAHLRAAVLYFMDLSEQCGYSVAAQIQLYHNIKPLFANKVILLVVNKIDVVKPEDLDPEQQEMLNSILADGNVRMVQTSCVSDIGVMDVRNSACEALLTARVEQKLKGTRVNNILNRIHLAEPSARDEVERPAFIPDAVKTRRAYDRNDPMRRLLARDIEELNGGAGVYSVNLREKYLLANEEWKNDNVPEIMDGKNVADFVDPEIEAKLLALDEEEERLEREGYYNSDEEMENEEEEVLLDKAQKIREKNKLLMLAARHKKIKNRPVLPRTAGLRTLDELQSSLNEAGLPTESIEERARSKLRDATAGVARSGADVLLSEAPEIRAKSMAARSQSNRREDGIKAESARSHAERVARLKQQHRNRMARASESDRHIMDSRPKHLLSGKRGIGKTTRR